jgi:seryl-tRNA synthetase
MTNPYDPKAFFEGMVEHGFIIPTAVLGTFGRSGQFEDIVSRIHRVVKDIAKDDEAEECYFPPVMDRKILEKVHYLETFPHLCGSIHSFFGNDRQALQLAESVNKGEPWGTHLDQTQVVLTPAACYPVYPTLTGKLPPNGKLIHVVNWVFRHEPSEEPTRLQSFRQLEYIRVGTPEQVVPWRDQWLQRGLDFLHKLQLPAHSDVASDPFFGRGGKMRSISQEEQKLKFEILVPVISEENPTAICSFNYHQDHFGKSFEIFTDDGQPAHTACLGIGMERITMALIKTHGFEPANWPSEVRKLLWF